MTRCLARLSESCSERKGCPSPAMPWFIVSPQKSSLKDIACMQLSRYWAPAYLQCATCCTLMCLPVRKFHRGVPSAPRAQVLRAFYLRLRAMAPAADGAPITTRQLESLIRLTEARARAELRPTATRWKACTLDLHQWRNTVVGSAQNIASASRHAAGSAHLPSRNQRDCCL